MRNYERSLDVKVFKEWHHCATGQGLEKGFSLARAGTPSKTDMTTRQN